ncbi:hypothetical protein [Exiguobacterium sp. s122]|uniref:hypothetical protein n=2 Tax=Exiguobacterium TaxID=33986 RepID=UPI001BEC23EF|nr:hypothetical protein [Exiguobacterium sp. s122]
MKLDYIDEQWIVGNYTSEKKATIGVETVLEACTGELTTTLEGELTVRDTVVVSRPPFTNIGDDFMYKAVTYVEGDQLYAVCRDMVSPHLQAEVVPSFPEQIVTAQPVDRAPVVLPVSPADKEAFLEAETLQHHPFKLVPFRDAVFSFSQAFYGEIEIAIDGWPPLFPLHMFEPASAGIGDIQMMLASSETESLPYILMRYGDGSVSSQPLEVTFDAEMVAPRFESLEIERLPIDTGALMPDVSYPVFALHYEKDGKPETSEMTFTYREGTFSTEEDRDLRQQFADEQLGNQSASPSVYVHKRPFNFDETLGYPDVLKAAGTDFNELIEAVELAEPVKRGGETGEYRLLTIVDGLKGQQFAISFKQRSKKRDVYITDLLSEQTFKLTSTGAETFFSYFPQVRK